MFVQKKLLIILALGASSIMQLRESPMMMSRKCESESSWQIPCDRVTTWAIQLEESVLELKH